MKSFHRGGFWCSKHSLPPGHHTSHLLPEAPSQWPPQEPGQTEATPPPLLTLCHPSLCRAQLVPLINDGQNSIFVAQLPRKRAVA